MQVVKYVPLFKLQKEQKLFCQIGCDWNHLSQIVRLAVLLKISILIYFVKRLIQFAGYPREFLCITNIV